MELICLFSALLSVHFHFVQSSNQKMFMEALKNLRWKKGLTDDHLGYDEGLETFGRNNVTLQAIQKYSWNEIVQNFDRKDIQIFKAETGVEINEKTIYDEVFYKNMINTIDQDFAHLLYDPTYASVATIFIPKTEDTKNTQLALMFHGVKPVVDYVAEHLSYWRSVGKEDKELALMANELLNGVAKWAADGQQISKDLTVVTVPIQKHKNQSIGFRVMKTLDAVFEQPGSDWDKRNLLRPDARSLGVYVHKSEELFLVVEAIDTGNLIEKIMLHLKTKKILTNKKCVWLTKKADEGLNKIAECIARGYGVSNTSNEPPKELAEKCKFDPNLYHGIIGRDEFIADNYKKDDFQYETILPIVVRIARKSTNSRTKDHLVLNDRRNIRFGIGFAVAGNEYQTPYCRNVFAIFQRIEGVPNKWFGLLHSRNRS